MLRDLGLNYPNVHGAKQSEIGFGQASLREGYFYGFINHVCKSYKGVILFMGWSVGCIVGVVCTKVRDDSGRKIGLVLNDCHDKFGKFGKEGV